MRFKKIIFNYNLYLFYSTSSQGFSSIGWPGQSLALVDSSQSDFSQSQTRVRTCLPGQSEVSQSDQLHQGVQPHSDSFSQGVCSSSGHSRSSWTGPSHSSGGHPQSRTLVCFPGPHSESHSDHPHHGPIGHSTKLAY